MTNTCNGDIIVKIKCTANFAQDATVKVNYWKVQFCNLCGADRQWEAPLRFQRILFCISLKLFLSLTHTNTHTHTHTLVTLNSGSDWYIWSCLSRPSVARHSRAALSPASTAPSMYPVHSVAVSVPAKYTLPCGLRNSLKMKMVGSCTLIGNQNQYTVEEGKATMNCASVIHVISDPKYRGCSIGIRVSTKLCAACCVQGI